jgi:hypothetical protein
LICYYNHYVYKDEFFGIRATPAVCKNFIYSISIFTLSATLYLFLLQQYSLFHSLFYLNILFYYFTIFKYYIFYFSILLFRTKNNQLPWRSEPKTTANLSNQKPPWRSEGSTTSRPLGSARQGGSSFAAWWSVLRGVVVCASRRGLGGYRSEKRATPWVSPWWWLASVGLDLRKEPWVSPWWWLVVSGGWLRKEKSRGSLSKPPPPRRRFQAQATTTTLALQAQSTTTPAFPTFNRSPTHFVLQLQTKRAQTVEIVL